MFEVTPLADGRTLVEGADARGKEGSIALWSPAWTAYQEFLVKTEAMAKFDKTVEDFFAPLVEASEELATATEDTWAEITVGENVEGVTARTFRLDPAGRILRILAETDGSSLRWINNGTELVAVK